VAPLSASRRLRLLALCLNLHPNRRVHPLHQAPTSLPPLPPSPPSSTLISRPAAPPRPRPSWVPATWTTDSTTFDPSPSPSPVDWNLGPLAASTPGDTIHKTTLVVKRCRVCPCRVRPCIRQRRLGHLQTRTTAWQSSPKSSVPPGLNTTAIRLLPCQSLIPRFAAQPRLSNPITVTMLHLQPLPRLAKASSHYLRLHPPTLTQDRQDLFSPIPSSDRCILASPCRDTSPTTTSPDGLLSTLRTALAQPHRATRIPTHLQEPLPTWAQDRTLGFRRSLVL
jgi:hypothetical protein